MASTVTLTSLAMLKVNIDRGGDYLDYLKPFILQVLEDKKPDPVTDRQVATDLASQFGLEIPAKTVQIVLKRISRDGALKRADRVYRIVEPLPNSGLPRKKAEAERHIHAVLSGLVDFASENATTISEEDAVVALCSFLSEFNIECLRAYLKGTAIPSPAVKKQASHVVLVSEYVRRLQQSNPERFESFVVMLQGHMLANALLCHDLHGAPKSYKGVTFYFDTPLLVQQMGLEGEPKRRAAEELTRLLHNLGSVVAAFSHTRDELKRVLVGAADFVDAPNGRGAIVIEARRKGTTKSDLLLLAGKVDDLLAEARIVVRPTPPYSSTFQIDESAFQSVLEDEVFYLNPRAKEDDINSVRSIYVLRTRSTPSSLERAKAVLVTSNTAFSKAAYEFGKNHEESREVSSVITDFSLANMAWLKAPMGAPSLPQTELLSCVYAALQPSKELLGKYLHEVDRLQKAGKISARDHQLLRSSTVAIDEMMQLTLGEEAALTEETVTETLRRVSEEITREGDERLREEQQAHAKTNGNLLAINAERAALRQRLYWKCQRRGRCCAWTVSTVLTTTLVAGIAVGFGLKSTHPVLGWVLFGCFSVLSAAALLGRLFRSMTVQDLHQKVETRCLRFFLRGQAKSLGVELEVSE